MQKRGGGRYAEFYGTFNKHALVAPVTPTLNCESLSHMHVYALSLSVPLPPLVQNTDSISHDIYSPLNYIHLINHPPISSTM